MHTYLWNEPARLTEMRDSYISNLKASTNLEINIQLILQYHLSITPAAREQLPLG